MISRKNNKILSLFLSILMVFVFTFTSFPSFADTTTQELITEDTIIIDLDKTTDLDLKAMFKNKEITKNEYEEILEIKKYNNIHKTNNNLKSIEENNGYIQPYGVGTFLVVNYIVFKYISANVVVKFAVGYVVTEVVSGVIVGIRGSSIQDDVARRVSNTIRGRKYYENVEITYDQSWGFVNYEGEGAGGGGAGGF